MFLVLNLLPPVEVLWGLSQWQSQSVKIITHLHTVPRLRMCGTLPLLLHVLMWFEVHA